MDVGGQRGGCQQLSQRKGACFLLNKKEASSGFDPSEWWWREERWASRECLWLPAIGTWGYPIQAYKWLEAMSVMFPISMAPEPHSSISEEFLHSIILRPKKPLGSWNHVKPLLSMNKAWMDECSARLQPLVDQYKHRQHQTFAIEKFRDLIVTTRSCPGGKNISLKKKTFYRIDS